MFFSAFQPVLSSALSGLPFFQYSDQLSPLPTAGKYLNQQPVSHVISVSWLLSTIYGIKRPLLLRLQEPLMVRLAHKVNWGKLSMKESSNKVELD